MLDEYMVDQPIAYKMIKNVAVKGFFSHAYLIESNGYSKKNDFVYSLAKFLLCKDHHTSLEEGKRCDVCNKNLCNQADIKVIKPEGLVIKKKQMEELQQEFSKKSMENERKIYIIEDAEKLNDSSANSILKFLEEPEDGIIAILVADNMYQLLDTIISRCQVISLKKDRTMEVQSEREKLGTFFHCEIEDDSLTSIFNFITCIEKFKLITLLKLQEILGNKFSSKDTSLFLINFLILFYKDVLNSKIGKNNEYFTDNISLIKEIEKINTEQSLCKKISILVETKENILYNANVLLQFDLLIKQFSEVIL